MDTPTATAIAITAGGLVQPYVQEWIVKNKLQDRAAYLVTLVVALVVATAATWLTGGFATFALPHFTLQDPSPLLAYLFPKWTAEFAVATLAFHLAPDHLGSLPTSPKAIAGTLPPPAAATP